MHIFILLTFLCTTYFSNACDEYTVTDPQHEPFMRAIKKGNAQVVIALLATTPALAEIAITKNPHTETEVDGKRRKQEPGLLSALELARFLLSEHERYYQSNREAVWEYTGGMSSGDFESRIADSNLPLRRDAEEKMCKALKKICSALENNILSHAKNQ